MLKKRHNKARNKTNNTKDRVTHQETGSSSTRRSSPHHTRPPIPREPLELAHSSPSLPSHKLVAFITPGRIIISSTAQLAAGSMALRVPSLLLSNLESRL